MLAVFEVVGVNALEHGSEDKPAFNGLLGTALDAAGKLDAILAGRGNGLCLAYNVVDWVCEFVLRR